MSETNPDAPASIYPGEEYILYPELVVLDPTGTLDDLLCYVVRSSLGEFVDTFTEMSEAFAYVRQFGGTLRWVTYH